MKKRIPETGYLKDAAVFLVYVDMCHKRSAFGKEIMSESFRKKQNQGEDHAREDQ